LSANASRRVDKIIDDDASRRVDELVDDAQWGRMTKNLAKIIFCPFRPNFDPLSTNMIVKILSDFTDFSYAYVYAKIARI
jgi:hypothetical protein